jgi:hypothetical protein
MSPLGLVNLTGLMYLTRGRPALAIGLIDGPVALGHPHLAAESIRAIPGNAPGACTRAASAASRHGSFVAGLLSARRESPAPAICPDCTLLARPMFSETTPLNGRMPSVRPGELAARRGANEWKSRMSPFSFFFLSFSFFHFSITASRARVQRSRAGPRVGSGHGKPPGSTVALV